VRPGLIPEAATAEVVAAAVAVAVLHGVLQVPCEGHRIISTEPVAAVARQESAGRSALSLLSASGSIGRNSETDRGKGTCEESSPLRWVHGSSPWQVAHLTLELADGPRLGPLPGGRPSGLQSSGSGAPVRARAMAPISPAS
jgi:hypothetical protein